MTEHVKEYIVEIEESIILRWIVKAENKKDALKKFEDEDVENTTLPDFDTPGEMRKTRVREHK